MTYLAIWTCLNSRPLGPDCIFIALLSSQNHLLHCDTSDLPAGIIKLSFNLILLQESHYASAGPPLMIRCVPVMLLRLRDSRCRGAPGSPQ